MLETKSKQLVQLKAVSTPRNTEYYFEVTSEAKALKEAAMKTQFEDRFEESLRVIEKAIHTKKGINKPIKCISVSAGPGSAIPLCNINMT